MAVIQWLIWCWWATISDSDSPCILAVTIFLSLFFGVTFPSLLLFLSRKNSLQFIVHQGGSISSLLPWERERERGANGASLLSQPGRGMMWRVKTKDEHERKADGATACCNFADMSVWMEKALQMLRGRLIEPHLGSCAEPHAFSHSLMGSHGLVLSFTHTRSLATLHRYSFVTALPRLSALDRVALVSVLRRSWEFTPVICFKAHLLDWRDPYVNSGLFTWCVQAFSFEITSVKRPGCFGNAVKIASGPS